MGRIERTHQAAEDVLAIWDYLAIQQSAPDAADGMVQKIDAALQTLAAHPLAGEALDRWSPGIRGFSVGNYILFYRPLDDGVRLIRVLHAARRWERLL